MNILFFSLTSFNCETGHNHGGIRAVPSRKIGLEWLGASHVSLVMSNVLFIMHVYIYICIYIYIYMYVYPRVN